MSDLISRKALLIEFNSMEMPAIDIITGVIESQPTAYDPDKVVEILNCWREEQRKSADELRAEYSNSDMKIVIVDEVMKLVDDIIDDTIEAVRKSGGSDE